MTQDEYLELYNSIPDTDMKIVDSDDYIELSESLHPQEDSVNINLFNTIVLINEIDCDLKKLNIEKINYIIGNSNGVQVLAPETRLKDNLIYNSNHSNTFCNTTGDPSCMIKVA
jgi:hypothetical protein